jgi:hypothetical protein
MTGDPGRERIARLAVKVAERDHVHPVAGTPSRLPARRVH